MIALAGNIQINGLGRAFARTLDHNRVYLTVPTTKTNHFYDVRTGVLGELWGAYGSAFPVVLAKKESDNHVMLTDSYAIKEKHNVNAWVGNKSGWSEDLALSCYPTTVSKIVEMVLDPRTEADSLQKVMVDYVKVKVNRHKSDGAWFFHVDNVEWDLEHVCNEITKVIQSKNGIKFTYNSKDVLDTFEAHAHDIFK